MNFFLLLQKLHQATTKNRLKNRYIDQIIA